MYLLLHARCATRSHFPTLHTELLVPLTSDEEKKALQVEVHVTGKTEMLKHVWSLQEPRTFPRQ